MADHQAPMMATPGHAASGPRHGGGDSSEEETTYLMSNPNNARILRRSLEDAKAGLLVRPDPKVLEV